MGVLSPAGRSLQAFWDTLCRARSVYGTIPSFADDAQYRVKIGAQIADDDWARDLPVDRYGKAACYCLYTVKQAVEDAGLSDKALARKRVGVIVGTTMGEIQEEEAFTRWICGKGEGSAARFRERYLRQGDICVVDTFHPSWTPALKMAAGLIMSYGNMLSHGAVVAREYGIPVVVFNGDALRVFRNGDWLDIRGNTGRIRIVQRASAPEGQAEGVAEL